MCSDGKLTLFEGLLDSESSGAKVVEEGQLPADSSPSDCESGVSGPAGNAARFRAPINCLIRVCDGELHEIIKKKLELGFGLDSGLGLGSARVEEIHRIDYSSIFSRAKVHAFCVYLKAMEMKCGGNANVRYAWFGASESEINGVLLHGFGFPTSNRTNGQGLHLSPVEHPTESVQFADPDENGVKRMLLCRVIMGKMEEIRPNSQQYNPSSEEFDSGVDNLASARKYIVWDSRMNTHMLPEFLVSFRASSVQGNRRNSQPTRRPKSDWLSFNTLIMALSRYLAPDAIQAIAKHHNDYRNDRLTRFELVQRVRLIAGDRMLAAVIRTFGGKIKALHGISEA